MRRAILLALSLLPSFAWAAGEGTSGAQVLALQSGARPRALGNAFTGVPDDINALFNNPAGIATLDHVELSAQHREAFAGARQETAAFVYPLNDVSAVNLRDFGALGLSAALLDHGPLAGRTAAGAETGDFDAKDAVFGATYGKFIGPRLALGITGKVYRLRIADETADGAAGDVGLLYSFFPGRWAVGVAARNLGSETGFDGIKAQLPTVYSAGASAGFLNDRLFVAADVADPKEGDVGLRAGLEAWASRLLSLRAGYDGTRDIDGFSVGIGIYIREMEVAFFPIDRLSIDYAFMPSSDFEDMHNVSLSLRFGDE